MILVCVKSWTNEMGAVWKVGDRVKWLYSCIQGCYIVVCLPGEDQCFELLTTVVHENFNVKS